MLLHFSPLKSLSSQEIRQVEGLGGRRYQDRGDFGGRKDRRVLEESDKQRLAEASAGRLRLGKEGRLKREVLEDVVRALACNSILPCLLFKRLQ